MRQDCYECPILGADENDAASLTLDINRKMLQIVVAGDNVPQRLRQIIDYATSLRDEWGEWHPDEAAQVRA
jgi:hypothetical protein